MDHIQKEITAPDGSREFQIRIIRGEGVGIAETRNGKAYFLLDSGEYWYDLIQEKYPPKVKCSCGNDWFSLTFRYSRRGETDDVKEVGIVCRCSACQKMKRLPLIKIDYSPSSHLLETPLTFCKKPRLKYKTYSMTGFWTGEELGNLTGFLVERGMLIYCWYWNNDRTKRAIKRINPEELQTFLSGRGGRYLALYFSPEPMEDLINCALEDEKGIWMQRDLWRKQCMIQLNGPFFVYGRGLCHQMMFCSEFLSKDGDAVAKNESFTALVGQFREYSRQLLKK